MTPRTVGSTHSRMPPHKKVENFINMMFGDQMAIENWVSASNENITSSNKNLPHFWYQLSDKGQVKKESSDKPSNMHLDFFRDLGPVQRYSITHFPEKEKRYYIGHANVIENTKDPTREEELYMLYLSGLLPIGKIPTLTRRLKEQIETLNSENSFYDDQIETIGTELRDLTNWEMLSDGNLFEESYGDETSFGSEMGSNADDMALLGEIDDNDQNDSSFDARLKKFRQKQ